MEQDVSDIKEGMRLFSEHMKPIRELRDLVKALEKVVGTGEGES